MVEVKKRKSSHSKKLMNIFTLQKCQVINLSIVFSEAQLVITKSRKEVSMIYCLIDFMFAVKASAKMLLNY